MICVASRSKGPSASHGYGTAGLRRRNRVVRSARSPGTGEFGWARVPTAGPMRRTRSPSRRKGRLRVANSTARINAERSAQNDRTIARLSGLGLSSRSGRSQRGERCRYGLCNSHSVNLRDVFRIGVWQSQPDGSALALLWPSLRSPASCCVFSFCHVKYQASNLPAIYAYLTLSRRRFNSVWHDPASLHPRAAGMLIASSRARIRPTSGAGPDQIRARAHLRTLRRSALTCHGFFSSAPTR